jgi:restriction system protein
MPDTRAPKVSELTNIILAGLRSQGGPTSTAEIRQMIDRAPTITAEQRALVHGAGPGTEVQYRTRWALVDLRRKGLVERVGPRSWRLTPTGPQGTDRPAH